MAAIDGIPGVRYGLVTAPNSSTNPMPIEVDDMTIVGTGKPPSLLGSVFDSGNIGAEKCASLYNGGAYFLEDTRYTVYDNIQYKWVVPAGHKGGSAAQQTPHLNFLTMVKPTESEASNGVFAKRWEQLEEQACSDNTGLNFFFKYAWHPDAA